MKGVTPYQFEVLQRLSEVQERNRAPADLDQVLELLSWMPTKASVQFTIRAMVSKKLIKKAEPELRRGRQRVVYLIEKLGMQALDPRRGVSEESAETDLPDLEDSFRVVFED